MRRDGETWFSISAPDRLPPFLVSLASDSDLWMYVTSRGGLTCGRVDAEGALFPYLTVDRLHDAHLHTGPVTMLRVRRSGEEPVLWRPLAATTDRNPDLERRLEKNAAGNRLAWEEIHQGLELGIRAEWAPSSRFGWVRTVTLTNRGEADVTVEVLDGLRNILPWGVPLALYQNASNLVDAYRCAEIDAQANLGIFALTSGITDRAEAVEMLRANTVWWDGPLHPRLHLDDACLEAFAAESVLSTETMRRGGRGHFFADFPCDLAAGETMTWRLIGDVGLDHARLARLRSVVREEQSGLEVARDLDRSQQTLRALVAAADGLQLTADPGAWVHHYANTLFNIMRGGVFADNHGVKSADFALFLEERHRGLAAAHADFIAALPPDLTAGDLVKRAAATGEPDLHRLALEYLPLQFGRRHGDPSRPWNSFTVRVRDETGGALLHYEGNWRDIFQNWEALARSYPRFLPHMVARFLNASTADGFNPYRLNRQGLEWETVEPEDPWANIGYWGDHQIVYLTRLLESWDRYDPEGIPAMLSREIFSTAEIPYRLREHEEILADPAHSIVFDDARHGQVMARAEAEGSDGKLLHDAQGRILHMSMLEKLLIPVLAKLSCLVPDGGIWMNTQRPEWNDANNALAGWGLSVVTLAHLRRHLEFLIQVLDRSPDLDCSMSAATAAWLEQVESTYTAATPQRDDAFRRRFLDAVGEAFAAYRHRAYSGEMGFGRVTMKAGRARAFLRAVLPELDRSLAANRRPDGLFHAYNILEAGTVGLGLGRLQEMLEGQVAVLSAAVLGEEETLTLLRALFASELYRPDQHSFMLYPRRDLPGFLARNQVPARAATAIALLRRELDTGQGRLVVRDVDGDIHFAPGLVRTEDVERALDDLAADPAWADLVRRERQDVLDLYEEVFHHRSYTGRSGTMFGYEGLGCIYWHMVAKLLLAVQETLSRGRTSGWTVPSLRELKGMYFRIREGLGYRKTITEFGAFPMDPYSHTPGDGGARQPGMTGQVKEEILTRLGELGVAVEGGALTFAPGLLEPGEFLTAPGLFRTVDRDGRAGALALEARELAFTICQTPVVYRLEDAGTPSIVVTFTDGGTEVLQGERLGQALSGEIFDRSGRIAVVRVMIPAASLDRA